MKKTFTFILALIFAIGAGAQSKTLTVKADDANISAEDAGDYDCVYDEWNLEKGTTYLLSLPAALDGYYFGPDAKRQKLTNFTQKDDGTYVGTKEAMADLDDFEAGEVYLVTPDIDVDTITHITPGIKTPVAATAEGKELLHTEDYNITPTDIKTAQDAPGESVAAVVYDLKGRKVSAVRQGETYIVNGKKLIIK